MYKEALAVVIMPVGLIAVDGQKGEQGDKLQTLPQDVGDRNILGVLVI